MEIEWPTPPQQGQHPINLNPPAWDYSFRYQAQPILPHLYLGPYHLTRGPFISTHQIQHILCIRDPSETMFLRHLDLPNTEFHIKDVPADVSKANIIPYFTETNQWLSDRIQDNILVCCSDGIDKGSAFVAAFLMKSYGLRAQDAIVFVQNQRYCATPSPYGYRVKLLEYEPICMAQRSSCRNTGGGDTKMARQREDEDEDEEAMEEIPKEMRPLVTCVSRKRAK